MSAVAETLNVDTLVPDGIEPVEAMRCWKFEDGKLLSLNGEQWTPGEPLVAVCRDGIGGNSRWNVVRRGLTYEQALLRKESDDSHDHLKLSMYHMPWGRGTTGPRPSLASTPFPPKAALPDGYGFALETVTHDCPDEGCSCGIYAATTEAQLPTIGVVYGKAKLWGKVVPGENGVRAQYAYPSEFTVPELLADDPALKAFGVPITVADKQAATLNHNQLGGLQQFISLPSLYQINTAKPGMHWAVKVSIALNLAACAFDLSMGLRLW